jgi:hypothetical protein
VQRYWRANPCRVSFGLIKCSLYSHWISERLGDKWEAEPGQRSLFWSITFSLLNLVLDGESLSSSVLETIIQTSKWLKKHSLKFFINQTEIFSMLAWNVEISMWLSWSIFNHLTFNTFTFLIKSLNGLFGNNTLSFLYSISINLCRFIH